MKKVYNGLRVRLDETDRYMIWFKDVEDGIVLDRDGEIPLFETKEDLKRYARQTQIGLNQAELPVQDLDTVQKWIMYPKVPVDCKVMYDAWNIFADLAMSLNLKFSGSRSSRLHSSIYEKLFWGSRSAAASNSTTWSEIEIQRLRHVMMEGLTLLRSNVKYCA